MTDVTKQEQVRVSTDGTAGPYIMVPLSQLDDVKRLLAQNAVSHWVEEHAISLNGRPAIAVINLGRNADARAVQDVLDSVN